MKTFLEDQKFEIEFLLNKKKKLLRNHIENFKKIINRYKIMV
jgi:hypothetical protein